MKGILKMILGLLLGIGTGLLIGGLFYVVFNGGSLSEYFGKLFAVDGSEMLQIIAFVLLWMAVSAVLQIVIHEAGHLVAGLLTGYRFVSFRVFSLTLIRKDGHFQFRRFALGGTGGQCLMSPPDRPVAQIDTRWYNLGGVLANVLVATAALGAFILCDWPMWAETWMLMLAIIGFLYALLNGLPLKIGGVGNDGHNLLHLEKSPVGKLLLCRMLSANALVQEGVQPKNLPVDFFEPYGPIDWSDGMQANWQMMVIARMENLHQWEEAYGLLAEAVEKKDSMLGLFWQEMACEMVFVCAVTGRLDEARQLYTPALQKYVKTYLTTQSSKQRIDFAATLALEGDRAAASQMLTTLKANRRKYLLQGEVDMDIELMDWMLQSYHTA